MGALMGDKPKHVLSFSDRHGHRRHYFRRKGQKLVPLPGEPGSPEFNRAYELAAGQKLSAAKKRIRPGSFSALVAAYYASSEFRDLRPITQASYRIYIEPLRERFGDHAGPDERQRRAGTHSGAPDARCREQRARGTPQARRLRPCADAADAHQRSDCKREAAKDTAHRRLYCLDR
jgi:hypothetical protein